MSDNNGSVTVLTSDKHEIFQLNGVVFDVATALEKFYGGDAPDVSVKLNGRIVSDRRNEKKLKASELSW